MPDAVLRPLRRSDRDQLTDLVNIHVDAVLPGVSVSPNAVLGQLEREPGEYVVDPWVSARHTLVAELDARIVGAVHLLRYADAEHVAPGYRDAGEIRWLLFRPGPGGDAVGNALVAAALRVFAGWGVARAAADCALPVPALYGVSDRWPHVASALERGGFGSADRVEAVLLADVDALPGPGRPPLPGLAVRHALGPHAPMVSAVLDGEVIGYHEVQGDLSVGGTLSRLAGWADVWNLWVAPQHRRAGVATWLLGHTADRLRRGGVRRLLDYAIVAPDGDRVPGHLGFLLRRGFVEITRNRRGWTLGRPR